MELTTVHVMRHGEVFNPDGVLYGRLPGYHLSERGAQMAAKVAEYLQENGEEISYVVASPLERAQESAAPTAKAYGLQVATDHDLIEAANWFEGKQIHRDHTLFLQPENLRMCLNPLRPSWGEPYWDIARRMVRAVRSAREKAAGSSALVVSHQLPVWILRRFAEGHALPHDPRRRECSLASLTSFTFADATLLSIDYCEPAAEFLESATDMTPGLSVAAYNEGQKDKE